MCYINNYIFTVQTPSLAAEVQGHRCPAITDDLIGTTAALVVQIPPT